MTQDNLGKIEMGLFFMALAALVAGIFYFGPSMTGFVIKEFSYIDAPNLVVTSNGSYTLQLKNTGELKSVKIDGKVTTHGNARVYLVGNGIKYLVFDSSMLNANATRSNMTSLITGFAVDNSKGNNGNNDKDNENNNESNNDKEKSKDNKIPDWNGPNQFIINGTALINLSKYFTDEDKDNLTYAASQAEGLTASTSNEIVTITPIANYNFNTTITFTASDGIAAKNEVVALIVYVNIAPATNQTLNQSLNITPMINQTNDNQSANTFPFLNNTIQNETTSNQSLNISPIINQTINQSIINETSPVTNATSTLNNTAQNETTANQTNPTQQKTITMNLSYNTGTVYDANDNGEESINGVVDLTVAGTRLSWDAEQSKLCTRWQVYSIESQISTSFCNGNNDCCTFVGLIPRDSNWSAVYYSTYNKDNSGKNNAVSAQAIYYDVNLSIDNLKSEIYYSNWGNLSVKFFDDQTLFSNICADTCSLNGLNKSSYQLIFEIEDGAAISIDKIKYSELVDVQDNGPILLQNFTTINVQKNKNATINLSQYFADTDNDPLAYNYYKAENLTIVFDNNTATIVPDKGFEGQIFTLINANDSEKTAVSNPFIINVSAIPINVLAGYFFEIRDKSDNRLAVFDSFGNLDIKGTLAQNTEPKANSNYFMVQNSSSGLNMVLTNPEGNMIIKGSLNENQSTLNPTPNSFIIQNKNEDVVAYVNSTGSLFLKGRLTQNVIFPDNNIRIQLG